MRLDYLKNLYDFISQLLLRRRKILGIENEDLSLVFCDALLRNLLWTRPNLLPHQIVVIGPTQAGKSTLVNLLIGREVAKISPLAGYTRHLHGFSSDVLTRDQIDAIANLLHNMKHVEEEQLNSANSDSFALISTSIEKPFIEDIPFIIWDTPDFDSTSSRSYRSLVPSLCAMADLIIMIVSKEKYADFTVWQTLRLISQAGRPLLICINKINEEDKKQLLDVLKEKLLQEGIAHCGICSLPFIDKFSLKTLMATDDIGILQEQTAKLACLENRFENIATIKGFIDEHWPVWTKDVRNELITRKNWEKELKKIFTEAGSIYERDYLSNPHYRATIQRTVARLLELLEIPGIGAILFRTRQIVTWPLKTLIKSLGNQSDKNKEDPDRESEILENIVFHIIVQMKRFLAEKNIETSATNQSWKKELWSCLEQKGPELINSASHDIKLYQEEFAREIESAAQGLYTHLEKSPSVLNALRAARVTADAAGLVFALKTGGIGLNDLILAPAMLTVTSILTESSVGRYMHSVEQKLKRLQLITVLEKILTPLQNKMLDLPNSMDANHFYLFSDKELENADNSLQEL